MKKLFLITLSILITTIEMPAQNWHYNLEEAKQLAKAQNKQIMIVFTGSDWCAACMKLEKQILKSREFIEYAAKHYILVRADFPRKRKNRLSRQQQKINDALAEQYNPNGIFPLMVVLDASGHVLGKTSYENIGPKGYIEKLQRFRL